MRILPLIVAFILLVAGTLPAEAGNPFLSKQKSEDTTENITPADADPSSFLPECLSPILQTVNIWQKALKKRLTTFARQIKENPLGKPFFMFLLFSFAYGILHAIGPGHGKTIVMSFFLNRPGKLWHGILMGHVIAIVHALSGALVVMVLALFLDTTRIVDFDKASPLLEVVSYSMVIAIGVYLFVHSAIDLRKKELLTVSDNQTNDMKKIIITSLVAGLVPCPGAALILLFSIISGIVVQGVLAILCVGLGMGLTTTAFALAAIGTRRSVLSIAQRNERFFIAVWAFLSFGSAALIVFIGSVLLAGAI